MLLIGIGLSLGAGFTWSENRLLALALGLAGLGAIKLGL
jgi:hypothetical protein